MELARQGTTPVSKIAKDLGISDSCLRPAATVPVPETIALSPDGKNAYVTSEGKGGAWQLRLGGHLPAGTAFRAATAGRGHCTALHAGPRGATVTCHLATLKAGATWRIHIAVTVKASTGTLSDQAKVTSVTTDPRTGNNTATPKVAG